MAHKLPLIIGTPKVKKAKNFRVKMPSFSGKFGFSLFIGKKEVFIGLSVSEVIIEEVVRRRLLKLPKKAKTKVYQFDAV